MLQLVQLLGCELRLKVGVHAGGRAQQLLDSCPVGITLGGRGTGGRGGLMVRWAVRWWVRIWRLVCSVVWFLSTSRGQL